MNVHLIDGTYELFRHHFAVRPSQDRDGNEVGAVLGVASSMLGLLRDGATHIGVATDHVVESFRNQMWADYKTSVGMEPELLAQFPVLEEFLVSMGLVVWAMVDYEADDALASAAARAARVAESRGIDKIIICTPDKDLSQCVVGDRVVQLDRRARVERNEAGVIEKFGVPPTSITDYLALVGDASDGFPGVPGWGAKSTAIVLGRYLTLEQIPRSANDWDVAVRGRERLAANLVEHWENALLFRDLATLRTDAPGFEDIEELRWRGPARGFEVLCERLAAGRVLEEARSLASARVAD